MSSNINLNVKLRGNKNLLRLFLTAFSFLKAFLIYNKMVYCYPRAISYLISMYMKNRVKPF